MYKNRSAAVARIILVILSGLCTTGANAQSLVREYTLNDLVLGSSDIVEAHIISKQSHWNGDKTRIYSEVNLEVISSIQGDLIKGDKFKIYHLGGTMDGITTFVLELPEFTESNASVLFLNKFKSANYGDHYTVWAMNQGKYDIVVDDTGSKQIYRHKITRALQMEKDRADLSIGNNTPVLLTDFVKSIKEYTR